MNKKEKATFVYIAILLFFIIICSYLAVYFYDIRKNNLAINALVVNNNSSIDYNVILEDNKFYDSSTSTDKYILDLINNIDGHFNYNMSFSNVIKGKYNYEIIGTLNGYDVLDNSNLLNKEIINNRSENFDFDGNVIAISSNFIVPIKDIVSSLNEFKIYYPNVYGEVNFNIKINYNLFDSITDTKLEDERILTMTIPLNDSIITIKTNNIKESTNYYSKNTIENNKVYYVIFLEFIGIIIIFILVIILMIKNTFGKSDYQYKLENILKNYDDYLAELVDIPNLNNKNIIAIDKIEDLVNIAEIKKEIIRYREIVKDKETIFFVLIKKDVYLYRISQ